MTPKPHPKNAPGPFYVVDGCCITCLAPHAHAPTLMGFDEVEGHCFVKQQPQTEDEIYRSILAVWSSEVQCLRYRGNDPEILQRLVEIGEIHACDLPAPASSAPVLRNYVTFESTFANDAWDVAIAVRDQILTESSERAGVKITPPKRKGEKVVFDYSWFEDNYYTLNFESGEPSTTRWLVHHSRIQKVGSVGLTLSIDDWLRRDPRFSNLRWYTSSAWRAGGNWQERPY